MRTTLTPFHNTRLDDLLPRFIGLDDMFSDIWNNRDAGLTNTAYPPHDIEKVDEDHYKLNIAVAGFNEEDLDISLKDGQLKVRGSKSTESEDQGKQYIYQGIAKRNFEKSFKIGENIEVQNASMNNGMLSIDLKKETPEEDEGTRIPINNKKSLGNNSS